MPSLLVDIWFLRAHFHKSRQASETPVTTGEEELFLISWLHPYAILCSLVRSWLSNDYLMAEKERTKRQALGAVFRVVTEDVVLQNVVGVVRRQLKYQPGVGGCTIATPPCSVISRFWIHSGFTYGTFSIQKPKSPLDHQWEPLYERKSCPASPARI